MPDADMTMFELHSLMANFLELALAATSLFITVVSGFLVMAYYIGDKLTRFQTWMASIVFLAFGFMSLYGAVSYAALGSFFAPDNYFDPGRPPFSVINRDDPMAPANMTGLLLFVIMNTALIFLFDIRRRAKNRAPELDKRKAEAKEAGLEEAEKAPAQAADCPKDIARAAQEREP